VEGMKMQKIAFLGSRDTAQEVLCFPTKVQLIIDRSQPNVHTL